MSLAKYLMHKGIVHKPSQSQLPHKGKVKSEDKEISQVAEQFESKEGEESIREMAKKMKQHPYANF